MNFTELYYNEGLTSNRWKDIPSFVDAHKNRIEEREPLIIIKSDGKKENLLELFKEGKLHIESSTKQTSNPIIEKLKEKGFVIKKDEKGDGYLSYHKKNRGAIGYGSTEEEALIDHYEALNQLLEVVRIRYKKLKSAQQK